MVIKNVFTSLLGNSEPKIEEIKVHGVTYYIQNNKIFDIDVDEGIHTIYLGDMSLAKCYHGFSIDMPDTTKTFPNITEIVIGELIEQINIPNSLFPNVEHVKSNSKSFKDDTNMLIEKQAHNENTRWILKNSFHQKEDTILDFSVVTCIGTNSLAGCRTTNIINLGEMTQIHYNAFNDYDVYVDEKTGAKLFGSILVDVRQDSEEIEIPDDRYEIKLIRIQSIPQCATRLRVHQYHTVKLFTECVYLDSMSIDTLILDNSEKTMSRDTASFPEYVTKLDVKQFEVSEDNVFYKTVDGILYSKDGRVLYKCPNNMTGNIVIPETVSKIAKYAFLWCGIQSVKLPKSLRCIEENAFCSCSSLEKVQIEDGIEYLSTRCFNDCKKLENIDIPGSVKIIHEGSFYSCPLKSITLHEGLVEIQYNAFVGCEVNDLTLPTSLKLIGYNNFTNTKRIHVRGAVPNGLFAAIIAQENRPKYIVTEIILPDGVFYLPNLLSHQMTSTLSYIEQLSYKDMYNTIPHLVNQVWSEPQKLDTALHVYEKTKLPEIAEYLATCEEQYIYKLADSCRERDLVLILQVHDFSEDDLRKLLNIAQENHMAIASAYILDIMKSKNKHANFNL